MKATICDQCKKPTEEPMMQLRIITPPRKDAQIMDVCGYDCLADLAKAKGGHVTQATFIGKAAKSLGLN